jgi:two-component system sensor histidine kinase DesK
MPSSRGSPQPPVASDSYHALHRDSSAAGRRAGHVRLEPAPGRYAAGMTAAPARHRDNGVDATAGATAHAGQAEDELSARRRGALRWALAGIWLIYLALPAAALWDDHNLVRRYVGLAALLGFGALFLATFGLGARLRQPGGRLPWAVQAGVTGLATALTALVYATAGQKATGLLVYLAVLAVFMFTGLAAWATVAVILVASLAIPSLVPGWRANLYDTFQILVAAVAMWGVALLIQRNAQLAAAQEEIARLVRAEERSRFGRDLHDILGHSLTVVAVKAELAGRLARTAPERAEAEIADMEHIAREALADVRAAAAGYREVTIASELASARTALTAACIQADLPAGLAHVPQGKQEIFGWAIREGVTNVVRHSGATHCSIRVAGHEVEITDDGRGPAGPVNAASNGPGHGNSDGDRIGDPLGADSARARLRTAVPGGPGSGHGLAGLRERAAAVGGSVIVGHSAAGGFALRLRVP